MAGALIVYGSTTGSTEPVAQLVGDVLAEQGIEVKVINVTRARVSELGNGYDLTLLGASTWGDDAIEFQEDFAPFYEEMDGAQLQGKKVALFGCGDSSYEHFCGAVDLLEEKAEELGAIVVNEPLRIDGDPQDARSSIIDWAREVASGL